MELSSVLDLEMFGKPFLLEKRIVLLRAIEEHGSISKAAKSVPMSYKSAWEAVDMMNALSPEPIVYRETGGKDGGGTTITPYGEKLLENYALLKEEHTRFMKRLSALTDVKNGTFKTIERLAIQLSARNQIQVEVISIESCGLSAKIGLKFKNEQLLYAVITQEAVENLNLEIGEKVTAIFKSSAVIAKISNNSYKDNPLRGNITSIEQDDENVKIVVDIGEDDKIVSVMPRGTLEINVGKDIMFVIQSNDVMIGK